MLANALSGAMPSPRISTRKETLSSCTAAGSLRGSASLPRIQNVSTPFTSCFSIPGWPPKLRRRASLSARFTGSGHRLEEEVHGGLLVEGVQPVVTEIEEALHLLHAGEERLARLPRGERFRMVRHRGAVAAGHPHHAHREQRDVAQRFEGDRVRPSRLQGGDLRALLHQQLTLRPFAGRELLVKKEMQDRKS